MLGTALQESGLTYLVQIGDATGMGGHGVYQDEPEDQADLYKNFIAFRPELGKALAAFRMSDALNQAGMSDPEQLESDLGFATVICRLHYFRSPSPMPAATDAAGMAWFYKSDYNTALGAAKPAQVLANFQRAVAIG